MTIKEVIDQYAQGVSSVEEVIRQALERAKSDTNNAILEVVEKRALERAKKVQMQLDAGEELPLGGVPFVAKDNFLTYGSKTTAASHMLETFKAPYQATAIKKLEAAGAILVAKANLDAFAHGSSTENSDFGPTTNPHDNTRVPGGSSGGSAASVALHIAPFALGTDTGGSIRQPASFCGVVGYKPTYGLVSRYGVVAMASSTDVIGPLAHSVEDTARVLDVLSGRDNFDSTTISRDEQPYTEQETEEKPLKIGVIKEYMGEAVDDAVRQSIETAVTSLKQRGAHVEEVSLPAVEQALACYYIIAPAEISSNLARYDGIRYGHQTNSAKNLHEVYDRSRSEGFNAENKRRIMIGNYVLSSGYYDAYYKKALQVRTLLLDQFNKAFEEYDVLVGPVAPTTAFKLGENATDPLRMYAADVMTVGVSLVGSPAISVPVGFSDGLPVGLQVIGRQGADRKVLGVARRIEELN